MSHPARDRQDLIRTLERVRHRVRLSRGRGAYALGDLIRKLHQEETTLEEITSELGDVLDSLLYAVEDAERDARSPNNAMRTLARRGLL